MTLGPGKIVGSFFIVCALAVCFSIVHNMRLAGRMQTVPGVLESIDYDHAMVGSSRASTYNIKLRFFYSVNGTSYRGHLISLRGNFYSSQGDAEALVREFANARQVTVWYDPAAPAVAIIKKPEVGARSWIVLLALVAASLGCFRFLDDLVLRVQRVTRRTSSVGSTKRGESGP